MDVAGVVSKIRLENFMCHSKLEIVLGDWVNFITGQNGSNQSSIHLAFTLSIISPRYSPVRCKTIETQGLGFFILLYLIFVLLCALGGKSAILTALCVAFGCRAKGTQRASTLKDFIKNGCRYDL